MPAKNKITGPIEKTIRLELDLFEPSRDSYPEFNFLELARIQEVIICNYNYYSLWDSKFSYTFSGERKRNYKEKGAAKSKWIAPWSYRWGWSIKDSKTFWKKICEHFENN